MWPVAAALALLVTPAPATAGGRRGGQEVARGFTQGARITLVVAKASGGHFRDELLPVVVRLSNTSPANEVFAARCGRQNPEVEVRASDGPVRFPPVVPTLGPLTCPQSGMAAFVAPGHTVEVHSFVVLRGSVLRARWGFSGGDRGQGTVMTAAMRLRLQASSAPQAQFIQAPDLMLQVERRPGIQGPLRYVEVAKCPAVNFQGPQYIQDTYDLKLANGLQVKPVCRHPLAWRVMVGWMYQPTATFTYVQGH